MAIVIFLLVSSIAQAEWSGQAKVYKTIPSDADNIIQSSIGVQVAVKHKESGLYPYLSYELIPFRFAGQRGGDINLWGFGFGIEREVAEGLSFFGQIGWYQPEWDRNGELMELWGEDNHLAEGLYIHLNNRITTDYRIWDAYSLSYSGNIGGVVGANWILPISKNVDFKLMGAYHYLRLPEKIKGQDDDYDTTGQRWEYNQDRDFGGWQAGVGIDWKF